ARRARRESCMGRPLICTWVAPSASGVGLHDISAACQQQRWPVGAGGRGVPQERGRAMSICAVKLLVIHILLPAGACFFSWRGRPRVGRRRLAGGPCAWGGKRGGQGFSNEARADANGLQLQGQSAASKNGDGACNTP